MQSRFHRSQVSLCTRVLAALLGLAIPATAQIVENDDIETTALSLPATRQQKSADLPHVEQLIARQTNDFREQEGLNRLERNENLQQAAEYFAGYMAKTDRYGHTADGNHPSQRAKSHGYEYCMVAENIAYQYSSIGFETEALARRFVQGWKQSPEHRENMLRGSATDIAVAVAQSEQSGNYYAVQMFGRPKSLRVQFQIANRSDSTIEYQIGERHYTLPPRYTRTHERCQAKEIRFDLPAESEPKSKTVVPHAGDRFVITGEGSAVKIEHTEMADDDTSAK
jgi:uncharacterized protein YkwD